MGTWGFEVFDNDSAVDVRVAFRELVASGLSPEEATSRLVELGWLVDPPAGTVADDWIGLAVAQWQTGRLISSVRDRALDALEAESPEMWAEAWAARQRVIERTKRQLKADQPGPVTISLEPIPESPFQKGDLLRFALSSGQEVGLWALTRDERTTLTRVSVDTTFVLLAFGEPALGPVEQIETQRPAIMTTASGYSYIMQFTLHLPQDATGRQWSVVGTLSVPEVRRRPSRITSVELRGAAETGTELADAAFSQAYELSRRSPSARTLALLALAAHLPNLPCLWDSTFELIPVEAAEHVAELVTLGDAETAEAVMQDAERLLRGGAESQRVAYAFFDRLQRLRESL